MRIAVFIATLGRGGAEGVVCRLANAWIGFGHDIQILTFENADAVSAFPLDSAVRVTGLDVLPPQRPRGTISAIPPLGLAARRLSRLRKHLKILSPDILVSFTVENNILAVAATRGLRLPVVISERSHPEAFAIGRVRNGARRLLYPLADAVVVQSNTIASALDRVVGSALGSAVIENPIDIRAIEMTKREHGSRERHKTIVSLGRLTPEKGHDDLIAAFAEIASDFPDWNLEIYGEGQERTKLETLCAQSGYQSRIRLPGATPTPSQVLVAAGVLAHPSHFEGAPNAVMEGLAAGCPIVASDAPGATAEILGGGTYGILVPPSNPGQLAKALRQLLSNRALRQNLSDAAPGAVAHYDTSIIAKRWIELFIRHTGVTSPTG